MGDWRWERVRGGMEDNINTILGFDFEGENNEKFDLKSEGDKTSAAEGGFVYSFEKSAAYTLAMEIMIQVYGLSQGFPKSERFGLIDQIRRASVSVVSNIAEGFGRNYGKGRNQFLTYSYASAFEVYCQLDVALKLGYSKDKDSQYENAKRKIRKLTYLISTMKIANLKDQN